ncbi:alcohol dehydrogenase [Favolaschia claudopus]|uniref:Alcohol dehydrogenase n=1 Tax=Favolaschia claudopus TaxID=2862362 RepID=A0AAW0BYM6_9AGAR
MTSIPTTMFAALYQPGNSSLVLDPNYPIRELEDNEILLKISATGVCRSDVEILTGVTLDTRTYVFGHEPSGVPVKLGAKVDPNTIQLGKLYSVLPVDGCVHGIQGGPALFNALGLGKDGAYAEFVIVTPDLLVPVPDGVPIEAAAVASDAGVTAYHAVKFAAQVKKGDKVLIFGVGGLGHLALQFAKHFGATVFVCDFKPAARQLALDLGADEVFDLIELNDKTTSGDFKVDTTMDFVTSNQTFNLAMAALRPNDVDFVVDPALKPKCVIVGVSPENLVFSSLDIITSGVQVLGSTGGDQNDLREVLDLLAQGVVRVQVQTEPLENINDVIDQLRAYAYTGRKVVIPNLQK